MRLPRPARLLPVAALAVLAGCPSAGPYLGGGTSDSDSGPDTDSGVTTNPPPVCGDGSVDPGEQCDDGNQVGGDGCENDCTKTPPPGCGDGVVDAGEDCDDGNQVQGDGCENNCTPTPTPMCGDGKVDPAEQCDDGNQDDTDACLNSCRPAACGDGVVQAGVEQCDDGNPDDTDACLNSCTNAACGDGFVQQGIEACDNGRDNADDAYNGCTTQCQLGPRCGDAIVQDFEGEKCDDGTPDGDDLCNACQPTPVRYVFATGTTYNGKFGSTTAADGLCTTIAGMNDVGAPGVQWTAWLSDNASSPAGRYPNKTFAGWYVLPGDPPVLVAKGWAGLTSGQLVNPIDKNELGNPVPADATVWTTTGVDGGANDIAQHCNKWNNNTNSNSGRLGSAAASDAAWTDNGTTAACNTLHRIYCVEN